MRTISKFIIHCSATPYNKDINAAQIDAAHRQRGFRCIGYHFVIYRDGTVVVGRPLDQIGAHCLGHNSDSIGICYIGGLDPDGAPADTRTDAQRAALISLIQHLRLQFPNASIHGHNEFAKKACPSFNVKSDPDLCNI